MNNNDNAKKNEKKDNQVKKNKRPAKKQSTLTYKIGEVFDFSSLKIGDSSET